MKRTLSLLMAVLMLTAVMLTGCSSGGTTSGAASSSDASSASSEAEGESSAAEENDLLAQITDKGTITVGSKVLKAGDFLSMDGFTGEVFEGKVTTSQTEGCQEQKTQQELE